MHNLMCPSDNHWQQNLISKKYRVEKRCAKKLLFRDNFVLQRHFRNEVVGTSLLAVTVIIW